MAIVDGSLSKGQTSLNLHHRPSAYGHDAGQRAHEPATDCHPNETDPIYDE